MVVVAPIAGLGILALVLWIIAFVAALAVIIGYIAGYLSGLPWPLDKLSGPVASLSQGLSHVAGVMFSKTEAIAGGAWHAFARYLDKTWEQMEEQAHLAWAMTAHLGEQVYDVTKIRKAVDTLIAAWRGIEHGVKNVEQWTLREERRIHRLEHALFHGIGEDVLPRLKTLEHEYEHIQNKELKAIRGEWATTEGELTALQKWVTDHVPLVGTATFAGAVAVALSSLGLGWLRCESNPFNNNAKACGLWSILGKVLGLAAFLTIAFDFRAFVNASEEVATFIGGAIGEFEGAFPLSLDPLPPPNS